LMILDYGVYQCRDRFRRSPLRHSLDCRATNSPALVTQRTKQRCGVVRLIITNSLCCIQSRWLITFSQTRRQLAFTFKPIRDVFDSDEESGNHIVVTQRRDRHSLLHLLEMFRGINGSTRDQVMMKGRCEHFHYAFVKRSLETLQQPALLEIGQQRSQIPPRSRFLTDAGEPCKRRIPNSNHELSVGCENADLRHPRSSATGFLVRLRLGFSAPLPPIILSMISPSWRARSARPDVLINVAFTPSALRLVIWRNSPTPLRILSAASRWLRLEFLT